MIIDFINRSLRRSLMQQRMRQRSKMVSLLRSLTTNMMIFINRSLLRSLSRRRMQHKSISVLFLERHYQPYKNEAPLGRNVNNKSSITHSFSPFGAIQKP